MISLLNGVIAIKTEKYVVVDINGVGYKVFYPFSIWTKLQADQNVKLFCHTHAREDAIELYGFLNREELDFFELLISISGIGPKAGLGIIALAPVGQIKEAIASGKEEFLTRISGIGQKIAKKIILELKDKIIRQGYGDAIGLGEELDAVDALKSLGYQEREAREIIKKLPKDIKGTENIIKQALKYLGKK